MDQSSKSEGFQAIEEQIKDNNVVTFKWLSRKLEIHNSLAKQLLQEYLDKSEDKSKYIVTLVVYGKKEQGDLLLSLVKESEFAALQSSIIIIDKHVYSIQPAESTFNPAMIYNIDKSTYEMKQLSLSSIKYNKEIIRKSTSVQSTVAKPPENSLSSTTKSTPTVKEKVEAKKESPKKESPPSKPNNTSKPETKKSIVKPVASSKGSISSFFQKQAAKGAANKTNSTPKNESPANQESPAPNDIKNPIEDEKTENEAPKAKRSKVESSSKTTENETPKTSKDKKAKTNGVSKTLESETLAKKIDEKKSSSKKSQSKSKSKKSQTKKATKQKKMKRIILQSDSSSEDEGSDQDSHISEPEPEEEPEPVIVSPKKEPPAVIISHGKKRKRKVVDKTVLDDDGYLHTIKETVYESCSSDENEEGGANNENIDNNKRFKAEVEKAAEIKTKTNNEEVAKAQSQKTKQASIMSFFKKPTKT